MNILAFDTSSPLLALALQQGDQVRVLHETAPKEQAHILLPRIDQLLSEASLRVAQLDAIAFGAGPGSFTGTRIASSVAQGMGFAAHLPVIRLSSLAVMAQAAFLAHRFRKLLLALDARMGEVYTAYYEINAKDEAVLVGKERVYPLDALPRIARCHDYYAVGDAWKINAPRLIHSLGEAPKAIHPDQPPTGEALLVLARSLFEQKKWGTASQAVPNYLR
ncbi:MAG: tRNA (adenosine(37)-N6)-threonylcarbamoyltransferase complex dimerization subunit type 1 TsaB [Gammaproteobacteria bacterium RIFCSPHIGHO2_12_FULL_45_12]|nr:MAG: tRNA (adenosine(37)-N6)-threonylcarbamoyltransferase complex dimerization subunit type 1 TsaB [Gammaproteobacteria bacterium RIFCSPHIGHO2_12_FULL_45_12]